MIFIKKNVFIKKCFLQDLFTNQIHILEFGSAG
jgi:hypothetical protein